jgi:putative ABC transport system permease protein
VTHVVDSYLGMAAYADRHYLSRLMHEGAALNSVQLAVDLRPEPLRRLRRELKTLPGIESITPQREMARSIEETLLLNQAIMIGTLTVFAGIMFFGSIVNASLVNLAERQREVATLLALGYSPGQVGGLFLRESMLVNLVGAVLGLPVGWLLMWLTTNAFSNDMIRLPVVTAPWVVWATLALAVVFGLAAHAVVQRSINRLDVVEALKVKE